MTAFLKLIRGTANRKAIPLLYVVFMLVGLFSTVVLSPQVYAFGEKYVWEDKETIDGSGGALGDYSNYFTKGAFATYPLTDPIKIVEGYQYLQPVTTPDGCSVVLGIQVNSSDKSKGTLRRIYDPILSLATDNCPENYKLSKHFTTEITLGGADNSGAAPSTRVTVDVRSIVADGETYPGETDTITLKEAGEGGKVIAQKKVTSANAYTEEGYSGFKTEFKIRTTPGQKNYEACSKALNLCAGLDWGSLLTQPLDIYIIKIVKEASEGGVVCSAGALGWVICPLIELMQGITETVASLLDSLLRLNPLTESTGGGGIYNIWRNVLNIANVALVIAFLFVIFSQSSSYGISSYGVKKMLPRIVAAAILMNISFFICQVLVDISNILGAGAAQLVQTASGAGSFSDSVTQQTSGLQSAVAVSITIAVLIFFLLGPVVLGFLAVFLTVAARYAIIVLLVLVAPLAFAAWILPNTEQYFRKWWKLFINMLLLYPMVMFVFAASIVASEAVAATANEVEGLQGSVMQIMALVVMALPLFSMPLLFKTAGGVLGRIDDMTKRGGRKGWDSDIRKRGAARVGGRMAANEWANKGGVRGAIGKGSRFTGGYNARRKFKQQAQDTEASRRQEESLASVIERSQGRPLGYANRAGGDRAIATAQGLREKREREETENAVSQLRAAGIYHPDRLVEIARGDKTVQGTKLGVDGKTLTVDASSSPALQRAATSQLVSAQDASGLEKLISSSTPTDKQMVYEEIQKRYTDSKSAGAHLVKFNPAEIDDQGNKISANGWSTERVKTEAAKALSSLSAEKLASQDGPAAQSAVEGYKILLDQVRSSTVTLPPAGFIGALSQEQSELSGLVKSLQTLKATAKAVDSNAQMKAKAKEGTRTAIEEILTLPDA